MGSSTAAAATHASVTNRRSRRERPGRSHSSPKTESTTPRSRYGRRRRRRVRDHDLAVATPSRLGARLSQCLPRVRLLVVLHRYLRGLDRIGRCSTAAGSSPRSGRRRRARRTRKRTRRGRSRGTRPVFAMSSASPGSTDVGARPFATDRRHLGEHVLDRVVLELEPPHRGVDETRRERHNTSAVVLHATAARSHSRMTPRFASRYVAPGSGSFPASDWNRASRSLASGSSSTASVAGSNAPMWPDTDARHTAELPGPTWGRNAANSAATAARSTRRISCHPAIDGERPAVCTSECRSPAAAPRAANSTTNVWVAEVAHRRAHLDRGLAFDALGDHRNTVLVNVGEHHRVDGRRECERARRTHGAGRARHGRHCRQRAGLSGCVSAPRRSLVFASPMAAGSRRNRGWASSTW